MASKKEKEKRTKYAKGSAKEKAVKRDQGFDSNTIRLPEGMSFYKVEKAGVVNLDIIPYVVKRGRDKKGGNPNCDSGLLFYERTYYIHRNVGAEGKMYVCLSKTFGEKCPICEHRDEVKKDKTAKKDAYKAFNPKQRQIFYASDTADPEKGVQLWDISYYLFGEKLDDEMEATPDGHPDLDFFDPESGSTLRIMFKDESFDGNDFLKASSVKFTLRDEPLPEEVFDLTPLDDLIVKTPYDKLSAIFNMEDVEEDDQDDEDDDDDKPKKGAKAKASDDDDDDEPAPKKADKKPAPAKTKPKDDDDEDDDDKEASAAEEAGIKVGSRVETDEHGPCDVVKITDDGDTLTLKDEDGDLHKGVDVADCELLKDKKADKKPAKEAPAKAGKKTPPAKAKDEDDEDEDDEDEDDDDLSLDLDDDDDEDEPVPAKKPAKKK